MTTSPKCSDRFSMDMPEVEMQLPDHDMIANTAPIARRRVPSGV